MVAVEISNGLGNQLFQYAAGRAAAWRLGAELKLETGYYEAWDDRIYELDKFRITGSVLNRSERLQLQRWKSGMRKRLSVWGRRCGIGVGPSFVGDLDDTWQQRFPASPKTVVLEGFWQSEEYFSPIADVVRQEFQLVNEPDEVNRQMLNEIRSRSAVAVHVRRGDYLTTASHSHGVCEMDYYEKAFGHLHSLLGENLHYYVFADEMSWVRENLKPPGPTTWVTHNERVSAVEDLRLMRECRHFIIANSTFSWWGAWLSNSTSKVVVAPKLWFADKSRHNISIVPRGWAQL